LNKVQLFDLTERVRTVAGVELPIMVGSQSLYGVTSRFPMASPTRVIRVNVKPTQHSRCWN